MKVIVFVLVFLSISLSAQKIEKGIYTTTEYGLSLNFQTDSVVKFTWSSCTMQMEAIARYILTDNQLILSYIQHPLDTFTPKVDVEYNDLIQKDSIEIALFLLDPLGSFSLNPITTNNYSVIEQFNDSFCNAKFKVSVASLPYTITTSLANCLYSDSISVIIEKPLNTYIGIDTSPYAEYNYYKYLKQGRKDTFDIKDVTNEGFTIINNKESETPSLIYYIKQ